MDDLKFQILGIVRDALPITPARRAHFYADTPNINRYKLDIDRLIASGYLREDTGSDKLYITTPGDLAYEQEKSHRDAMKKYEWQLKALQEMTEAAQARADAAQANARAVDLEAQSAIRESRRANRIATVSVILSAASWLFTANDVHSFLSGVWQWFQNLL